MRIFIYLFIFSSLLQAQNIDQLIDQSLKKHPSLKTIQHRLSAMDERIEKSQNWANPDLSFTINDIQFDDISNRSLEPMQYQAVNFKQKFPWFGKLDARKTFAKEQKHIILDSYNAARVQLAFQIRTTAYTIKELEARIHILRKYSQLARQNIQLYTDTIATNGMSHADSISAELSLSKIKIRRERYNSILLSQKEKLVYLVQRKVTTISNTLSIQKPGSIGKYLNKVTNNPSYQMKLTQNRAANANKKLIDLDANPDPFVEVGYFNRANYEDYASISLGFSLPLYGTEILNSEIARKETLATQSAAIDYKLFLDSEIHSNFTKLREAYRIYKIIQVKSLPQIDHMLELSSAAIEEGSDLFTYTNILEQKLALEEESITIKAEYQRTTAKLKALTGEI
jgi:outer membrane protein TolC